MDAAMSYLEPWLREKPITLHPLLHGLQCSFEMAAEELARATADLSEEQIWASPQGLTPIGFHLVHIHGSIDRLLTYAQGRELSPEQLAALAAENNDEPGLSSILHRLEQQLGQAKALVEQIDPAQFTELRYVGRRRIPVPLGTLLLHVAEHTQRHVGQVLTTAKLFQA
jgi:uncharacterized damage-inducible protein DinB